MKRFFILLAILLIRYYSSAQQKQDYAALVDPFIESTKSRYFFFNSACRPFGMVNLSPDNILEREWASGYRYQESEIRGLTHIHDWGVGGILLMPTTGNIDYTKGQEEWKTSFSHDREVAKPGYHQVYFDKYNTNVELTSTTRVGFHRYTFDKAGEADILLYLGGQLGSGIMKEARITAIGHQHIQGWVLQQSMVGEVTLFFSIYYDKPFKSLNPWSEKGRLPALGVGQTVQDKQLGVSAKFDVKAGEKVKVKVGVSWCGIDQAELNLQQELKHWDFDRIVKESNEDWNNWLGRIEVEGGTKAQRIKFYTDLWRSLLGRRQIQDANGKYPDYMSGKLLVKQLPLDEKGRPKFMHLSTDALWMTMWNLNILWGVAYPEVLSSFVQSSMVYYEDGGHLPRGPVIGKESWIMTGSPVSELIVGAYMLGIRDYDVNKVFDALKKAHMPGSTMDYGGGFLDKYIAKGYVPETNPAEGWGGAGRTMEFVTQDWALAQLAAKLGKEGDHAYFLKRSGNWTNMFDPSIGFIRPKNEDGSWTEPFDPVLNANFGGFVEANSWQTTWMAVHDIKGLVNVMGGVDAYCDKLNFGFEQARKDKFVGGYGGNYVNYSNQPGMVMAHLFNYAGKPWLSQYWVRQVYGYTFSDITPQGGYGGNDEDQGQMAAMSALIGMGLFDVKGGIDPEPLYQLTAPLFDRIRINLNPVYYPGKVFEIVAKNNGPENVYIQSAKLNGKPLYNNWFKQKELINGGTLELVLGNQPNKEWGFRDTPPSQTVGEPRMVIGNLSYPVTVKSSDWIEVSYQVENEGALGSHFGRIMENDAVIVAKDSVVKSGETKTMNYKFRLFKPGSHLLKLGDGQTVSIDVSPKKSELLVESLTAYANGEHVHGSMLVINHGSSATKGSYSIRLGKDHVKTGKVNLAPGQTDTLSFDFFARQQGTYDLSFNGKKLRSFDVKIPQVKPEDHLVLYYDFNDANTPTLDLSGIKNYPQVERLPDLAKENQLQAAKFEKNNHLRIEDRGALSPKTQLALELFLKPTNWYSFGRVLQKGRADNQYLILRNGADELEFKLEGVTNGLIKFKLPEVNRWLHLICQYDGKTISVWADGKRIAAQSASGEIAVTTDPLFIGVKNERTGLEDSFKGLMSYVKLYSQARSAEQIEAAAKAALSRPGIK
ncbi:GH92 family glycosyl hydrolase [Pedobacter faecalis]|uniref:GH92 family glycosyl hydrolase n=1 Tax=Pedobacter faecalis TaxID=3041495 RepID=UPI00254B872E|nr:GH92 family glycosyl hydrolase [Pedobacter sp. ELA7]